MSVSDSEGPVPLSHNPGCFPSKVLCTGKGLSFGYLNHPIIAHINTREAGPGELSIYCDGPQNPARCEVNLIEPGIYELNITAQEPGQQTLHIEYDKQDVSGSPYFLKVSSASLIKISGQGLNNGLLKKHKSEFILDTEAAGPGDVNVQVGGPPGAFKLKTKKKDRRMICRYDPKVCGVYIIRVMWDGDHIPGSPFNVFLAKNEQELRNHQLSMSDA